MYREKETVKCEKCGYDTGIPINGPFMRVIPPEGLKCFCGRILIHGNNVELGGDWTSGSQDKYISKFDAYQRVSGNLIHQFYAGY